MKDSSVTTSPTQNSSMAPQCPRNKALTLLCWAVWLFRGLSTTSLHNQTSHSWLSWSLGQANTTSCGSLSLHTEILSLVLCATFLCLHFHFLWLGYTAKIHFRPNSNATSSLTPFLIQAATVCLHPGAPGWALTLLCCNIGILAQDSSTRWMEIFVYIMGGKWKLKHSKGMKFEVKKYQIYPKSIMRRKNRGPFLE